MHIHVIMLRGRNQHWGSSLIVPHLISTFVFGLLDTGSHYITLADPES